MLFFPNAKINLGLNIIEKREDGFHNIESVFFPVAIQDAIEFVVADEFSINFSGIKIEGNASDNLLVKAYNLIKTKYNLPPIKIHLHKHIPMGAGLGGGSADAAFLLKALNEYFSLQISTKMLQEFAAQLGSDCAYFILNTPCFAKGRGEILEPISLSIKEKKIMIVHPAIHVNTAWAYSQIKPSIPQQSIQQIINQDISTWKDLLKNDFEIPVFSAHPAIEKIKDELYQAGALYASMSGSGSAVFGIFANEVPAITFPQNYFVSVTSV